MKLVTLCLAISLVMVVKCTVLLTQPAVTSFTKN